MSPTPASWPKQGEVAGYVLFSVVRLDGPRPCDVQSLSPL
jgi:hypothetical protein